MTCENPKCGNKRANSHYPNGCCEKCYPNSPRGKREERERKAAEKRKLAAEKRKRTPTKKQLKKEESERKKRAKYQKEYQAKLRAAK